MAVAVCMLAMSTKGEARRRIISYKHGNQEEPGQRTKNKRLGDELLTNKFPHSRRYLIVELIHGQFGKAVIRC
jgi:hypothetical protein